MQSTTPNVSNTPIVPSNVLSVDQRRFRRQILEQCFAAGTPVDREVLSIILAAKSQRDEPFRWWTASSVRELLWIDVVEWCLVAGIELPGTVPETMWALVGALPVSDEQVAELREPLTEDGGLDRNGRRRAAKRRHPSRKRVG